MLWKKYFEFFFTELNSVFSAVLIHYTGGYNLTRI